MSNWYINRDELKQALRIPATTTGNSETPNLHGLLDIVIEGVSRQFDDYLGYHLYPTSGSRVYEAEEADELYLDRPLTAIDSIQCDFDDNASYEVTLGASTYYGEPVNAPVESPPRPWWCIEIQNGTTGRFPVDADRGVKVTGTWGYFNVTKATNAAVASSAITSGTTSFGVANATTLHPGQTILVDSERMFVTAVPRNSSDATTTSGISVERAVGGTVAAAHAASAAISVYQYPVIDRAALYQAQQDYRAMDAPMGFAGADSFGSQRVQSAGGGLHPFTRRMLDPYRRQQSG